MLSKLSLYIISRSLKLGSALRINPYTWDDERRTMDVKPERTYFGVFKSRNFGFRIISGLISGNLVFAGLRVLQSFYFLSLQLQSFQDCMYNFLLFLVSCLSNIAQLNTIYMHHEISKLGTMFFQYETRLTGEYMNLVFDVQGGTYLLLPLLGKD